MLTPLTLVSYQAGENRMDEAQKQLVKDLVIEALSAHQAGRKKQTRKWVKDAWAIIDELGGPGQVVSETDA